MKTSCSRRNVQHLRKAFTVDCFSYESCAANLNSETFLAWSKLVKQSWNSSTIAGQGIRQVTCSSVGDSRLRFKRGRAKYFCFMSDHVFGGQSNFSKSNPSYASPNSQRVCSLRNNQYSKLCFELIPGCAQVSNISSRRSFRSHILEMTIPSSLPSQEGNPTDRNSVPPEREEDSGVGEQRMWDTKVRKKKDGMKLRIDDEGIECSQQHVRVWEYETRQREGLPASPLPIFQKDDVCIPVMAFYISRSVDLKRLSEEPFLEITTSRNNLIIKFANRPDDAKPTSNRPGFAEISCSKERFMVAFQYGSIVFFNFGDDEEEEALTAVRKFCTDEFRETRKDDYGVLVRPTLPEWSEGGQDRITLRMLDTDNIRVISSILGQSIALDHYAKKVDEMVNTFSELNQGMEKTGTFTMTRKSLFQLVATANTTLADVILRLGLLERSDAAWKDANYAQIWEYLRDDFELDDRFESLDFKLNVIQILQNRKSDTLEWIIILLITGEICVGVYQILLETSVL